jgi:hypothetical protein
VNRNQGAESTLAYLLVAILDAARDAIPVRGLPVKGRRLTGA